MLALAHQCLIGTPSHQVPLKACWRFRLGLHLALTGGDFDQHMLDGEKGLQVLLLLHALHFTLPCNSTKANQLNNLIGLNV